jgi:hypothetical protein
MQVQNPSKRSEYYSYAILFSGVEVPPLLLAKLEAMMEDCIDDLSNEMWGAFQVAGRQYTMVERMAHVQVRGWT